MTRLQGNNAGRTALVVGTLIAVVLVALALFAVRGRPAPGSGAANFNLDGLPYEGRAEAPVSVVVVEDFKCPVCKQFEEAVAPELRTRYVDTGQIKMYSLVWPFLSESRGLPENDSKFAAQAAKCVYDQGGNSAFTAFKAIVFRAQGDENTLWATKTRLKDLASNVAGIEQAPFAQCLDSDATAARVDADEAQVTRAQVTGTPTVFVNGQRVNATVADIGRAIDAAQQ